MLARNVHKAGWVTFENYLGLGRRIFTVVALGAIFLAIVCVLSGCGSDNSSPSTTTKKKIAVKELPGPKGPGKLANAPNGGMDLLMSDLAPGLTADDLRAKEKEALQAMSDPNFEVLPGMTVAKLKAKETDALRKLNALNFEALPGVTMAELKAKQAAALQNMSLKSEVLPGMTMVELKAKESEALRKLSDPDFDTGVTLPK